MELRGREFPASCGSCGLDEGLEDFEGFWAQRAGLLGGGFCEEDFYWDGLFGGEPDCKWVPESVLLDQDRRILEFGGTFLMSQEF